MKRLRNIRLLRIIYYNYKGWKENHSYVRGSNNIVQNRAAFISSRLQISGDNNSIIIEKGETIINARIFVQGSNCNITIKTGACLRGTTIYCQDDNLRVMIGHSYLSSVNLAVTEGRSVIIGDNCMLAGGISIKTGDSHSILDISGNRLNKGKDVRICNHVWIGEGAKILKGVTIAEDSVVATGAIVVKDIPSNQLWGGIPAKLLKKNISWDESRTI